MDRGVSKRRNWGPRLLGCQTYLLDSQNSVQWMELVGLLPRYAVLC